MASLIEPLNEGVLPETVVAGTPLSAFLASPALEIIAETIEREYYDQTSPRKHYRVVVMLKLLIIKSFTSPAYVAPFRPSPRRIAPTSVSLWKIRCRIQQHITIS